jgi:hypothetical protein
VKRRAVVLALFAAVACRALPSAVPLSDLGGAPAVASSNARDRRSITLAEENGGAGSADEIVVVAEAKSSGLPAVKDAPVLDAGADAPADAAPAATLQWPGDYYGSDRFVRRFGSEPEQVQTDDKAHTRVEQPSQSSLVISVVNSLTGEVICALRAGVNGAEATLESGQSCFAEEGLEAEVTSGRAKLAGDLLTLDFEGQIDGEEDEDSGRDSYHFEGRRR